MRERERAPAEERVREKLPRHGRKIELFEWLK